MALDVDVLAGEVEAQLREQGTPERAVGAKAYLSRVAGGNRTRRLPQFRT